MLTLALTLASIGASLVVVAQPPMRSTVIPADSARNVRPTAVGSQRSLIDTVTATFGRLESHVTTLAPGQPSHAPHKHVDEELIVVQQGTLETSQEGVARRAGPGSVIFQASNEMHGLRNVGADTAVYLILRPAPRGYAPAPNAPNAPNGPNAARRPVDAAAFLAGCWARRQGARLVEEQWLAPRGGTMLGVGRTTRGDTLVEFEQVRIYERGDTLVYAAAPSGQAPAEFRAAPPLGGTLTFSNPTHDFPQRVIYRSAGPDSLVARVEGTRNGATRGVDFAYGRVACGR
jgi:quercetin dioxygenase-like cupin family protein